MWFPVDGALSCLRRPPAPRTAGRPVALEGLRAGPCHGSSGRVREAAGLLQRTERHTSQSHSLTCNPNQTFKGKQLKPESEFVLSPKY